MVFSSLIFLCGFLPFTVLIYRMLPSKTITIRSTVFSARNFFLLLMSLLFYAWGEPIYILLMLFSILLNYVGGLMVHSAQKKQRQRLAKAALILTLVLNLSLLGFFKYTDFLIRTINSLSGAGIALLKIALPIGISFYTFQALSYVIDVYRGEVSVQHNFIDFAMYVTLFPQLIAGPIVRYADVEAQLLKRDDSMHQFCTGLFRFGIGLGKKALLANQAGKLWETIAAQSDSISAASAWIGAIAFTFQIYFDFSGYSDMAIGLGKMFGFTFVENFRYPYQADSITDFWRRWHITLSTWFREYVYIPLGGNRKGLVRQIVNLLIVWSLTGLWHGAGWNFLLWGVYFFLLLVLEKTVLRKLLAKTPAILKHCYALLMIVLGWVIFAAEDFTVLQQYCKALFGANGWYEGTALYHLSNYGILFIIMSIASTELPTKLAGKFLAKRSDSTAVLLQGIWCIALLVLSFSAVVADSYNPFLYFRF